MKDHRLFGIFLRHISKPVDRFLILMSHQRKNISQTYLLGVFRHIHDTVDIGYAAVMRSHIFISGIVQSADGSVEYEITYYREKDEQHRYPVHLEHEDKSAYAGYTAEDGAENHIHRLYKTLVRLLHGQRIFVIEIAVLETFKFHIPRLLKQLKVQALVDQRLGIRIHAAV